MLSLFATLQANLPLFKRLSEPQTEGVINRLHYRVTVTILMGCSLLVTCLEWVGNGNRISCVMEGAVDSWTIAQNVINTYCYILTTFTVPKHWNAKIGAEAASMGVGAFNPDTDDVSYKAYYQWVPFVLFFQGLMFYAPHALFRAWEGGKISNIIAGLNQVVLSKEDRTRKERILADYVVESLNTHNLWALKMLLVEFLNLAVVIGNIYFIDLFLGGEFSTYGINVISFIDADPEQRIDPMASVFPRVTKCSFYKYGPSGSLQTHDSICVLPINIVNEKIYVFLWFWLIILSCLTILGLLYHLILIVTPGCTKVYLQMRTLNQPNLKLDDMGQKFEVGDWKLLYLLAQNMEPLVFGEFLRELFIAMNSKMTQRKTSTSRLLDETP